MLRVMCLQTNCILKPEMMLMDRGIHDLVTTIALQRKWSWIKLSEMKVVIGLLY